MAATYGDHTQSPMVRRLWGMILPVTFTWLLFVICIFVVILPLSERGLIHQKRDAIRRLTESAWSQLAAWEEEVRMGRLTQTEAQSRAADHLRRLRYGPEMKDYFWVTDMHPRMVVHPYRPDLEGQDLTDYTDPKGKQLFVVAVETVRAEGHGYLDYMWQVRDDPQRIVPKLSYVKLFEPWQWVVGTGMYIDDVRAETAAIQQRATCSSLAILLATAGFSFFIILRGARGEGERARAEHDARRERDFSARLIQDSPAYFVSLTPDGAVRMMNDAVLAAIGYDVSEVTGVEYAGHFVPPSEYESTRRAIGRQLRTREPTSLEGRIVARDGSELLVEWHVRTVFTESGEPEYLFGIGIDVTARRQAEAEEEFRQQHLIQADKMVSMGILVSGVAHEINNPNHFIMSNASLLLDVWEGVRPILERFYEENGDFSAAGMKYSKLRDDTPALVSGILEGSERIKSIVQELRDFTRQQPPDLMEPLHVNAVIKSAITLMSNMIKKSTDRSPVEYGENLPYVKGHFQRLEHVVINLIQNACQTLPDRERGIFLSTRCVPSQDVVLIEVRDEGLGIPPEQLGHITDPFFTTQRHSGHIGLGLWVSATIIHQHGGALEFSSVPGVGTTATIRLPAYHEDEGKSRG